MQQTKWKSHLVGEARAGVAALHWKEGSGCQQLVRSMVLGRHHSHGSKALDKLSSQGTRLGNKLVGPPAVWAAVILLHKDRLLTGKHALAEFGIQQVFDMPPL